MRTLETAKKKGRFKFFPEEAEFISMSLLDRQIHLVVHAWRSAHGKMREAVRLLEAKKVGHTISTLERAEGILKILAPFLGRDPRTPRMTLEYNGQVWAAGNMTDHLARCVNYVSSWIKRERPQGGRPPERITAGCAEDLYALLQRETKRASWPKVARLMETHFPESIPPEKPGKEGERDLGKWIYNLVMRNHKRRPRQRKRHRTSMTRRLPEMNFLPGRQAKEVRHRQSWQYQLAMAEAITKLWGGNDLRADKNPG